MGKHIIQTCQNCKKFPCLSKDGDASVASELKGSYPLRDEADDQKPCAGDLFEPWELADVFRGLPAGVIVPAPPPAEKHLYILKASNDADMQVKVDNLTKGPGIVDFGVEAMTSSFDQESSKALIVVALRVVSEKAAKPDLAPA